jgi:predicted ATPase
MDCRVKPGNDASVRCTAPGIQERFMSDLIRIFTERGDLAHLALLLWAAAASFALWFALRELGAASRRFDDFVRELQRFNRRAHRRGNSSKTPHHD